MAKKTVEKKIEKEVYVETAVMEPDKELLTADADAWCRECGFSGQFRIEGPNVEKFPRFGYGYVVMVRELEGKQRLATAKYTNDNKRAFWQLDGLITG